ncbi:mycothiol synthase [Saccharopolyspora rosea]|uniref:Mycothiol acetyltransferase n=1 Tax=Saccharopolyspora rosea TaxID=524884 RepID=A0ABW3FJZ9_9PSEU|nr:mycothiol synthase [Saccharopolyspora rosea]
MVVQLTWRNGLDGKEAAEVMNLLAVAERADGVAPCGEHVVMRLKAHRDVVHQIEPVQADVRSEHFVVRDSDGALVGYAHVDTEHESSAGQLVAELAVHPEHRRRGVGARLVEALLDRADLAAEPAESTGRLLVWSHGEHPGALRLAERYGFARPRELWRMGMAVADRELPEVELPAGVRIRPFRPGADERAVVRVNHRAFSWHPEQGGMTEEDLRAKEGEDWFDAAGFLLAVDADDRLLGFHWTKVHPDGTGEVYVVGVDPDTQGNGLGRSLTVAGLRHLRDTGCRQVMLYVEADNVPATTVYQRLGFERWDTDVQFAR